MATASKRITRKQLRQPDWFQVTSENAVEYFEGHKVAVILACVAILVMLVAIWAWQGFKEKQNIAASQEFSKAVELYQGGRFAEALSALEKVETYRWSRYAGLAYLYHANSYLAMGNVDKALTSAQRAVSATGPNTLYRQIALVAQASAEERKNNCKDAIAHYAEAQAIPAALQGNATLGKARCAEQLGDKANAIASYKEYVKENPGSPFTLKLAELESAAAKTVTAPAVK